MDSDLLITLIVCTTLLIAGIWCFRRGNDTRFKSWLRLQSYALFALIPIVFIATASDLDDSYSNILGEIAGLSTPIYWLITALYLAIKPRARPLRARRKQNTTS